MEPLDNYAKADTRTIFIPFFKKTKKTTRTAFVTEGR